ncbi:MAG: hypothetical protein IKU55_00570 [Clostridia bacterium]|nr:hypothetical protein [Clostridia bacterium]
MDRISKFATVSLGTNTVFSVYHLIVGVLTRSWWMFTLGFYYLILSVVRFFVLKTKKKRQSTAKITGILLMFLTLPLVGTVILAVMRDRGHALHMIIMIAMATYAFTKITLAAIHWVKSRHSSSAKIVTLRSISFADAFVSIFALQRSMLVSFEGMSGDEIRLMNALLGSAVCVIVFLLGLRLLYPKNMH